MNIRDVVTALAAKAGELPSGWDTEVRVSMCDGERAEVTAKVEVDHMASISPETLAVNEVYVVVQGHPHDDERVQRLRGIAADADDAVQCWTGETGNGTA